jgi:hypothetical protein
VIERRRGKKEQRAKVALFCRFDPGKKISS